MATSTPSTCSAASAVSEHLDTRTAATEVAHDLHDGLTGPCDLVFVFASFHHRAALPEAVETIRRTVDPGTTLAVTTEGTVGGDVELEGRAGLSALALSLPGVRLVPWTTTPENPFPLSKPDVIAERIGVADDFRVAIMFGEPFSTPITRLLPALSGCGPDGQRVPVVGGMASGASQPGRNVLVLNDRVLSSGAIGVSVVGPVAVDFVVSQGCRPIGEPLVVTRAKSNRVFELGGRPALEVMEALVQSLDAADRKLIARGLLLGNVIDEHRRPFGRGDFLVRNLMGVDRKQRAIMVGDVPRIGQTVQFQVRDAVTAGEDLQLLLDAEVMNESPFGALLVTCNGRGRRLFGRPNHDIGIIHDRLGPVPTAGYLAAGEIGPIGDTSFLHGHSVVLTLFRAI